MLTAIHAEIVHYRKLLKDNPATDKATLALEMECLACDDEAARIEMDRDMGKIKSLEKVEEEGECAK
jgi:hypothetical protein